MADLANFFAKKDKKKKSKKNAEIAPDDLLKKIEQETQGMVDNGYDSNGDQPQRVASSNVTTTVKDDDEWDEFERDREVDLSQLKIQNLNEKEKERQEVEDQEELQKAVEESKSTMKWNIARKDDSSDDDDIEEENESAKQNGNITNNQNGQLANEAEKTATAPGTPAVGASTKYVPPSKRNGASQDIRVTPASGVQLEKVSVKRGAVRNQKIDVNSVDQFPSLEMAVHSSGGPRCPSSQDGAGLFTSVRNGARNIQENTPDQRGLSTSNKFSALKGSRT